MNENIKNLKNAAFFLLSPIIIFYLMEWLVRNPWDSKWGMKLPIAALNIVFFYIFALFLLFITGRLRSALRIEAALALFIGISEYYIQRFRGVTILPWDIFSLRTGISVANNYSYHLERRAIIVIALFIVLFALLQFVDFSLPEIWQKSSKSESPFTPDRHLAYGIPLSNYADERREGSSKIFIGVGIRAAGAALTVCAAIAYSIFCQSDWTVKHFKIYDKLFTPTTMTWRDGTLYAFVYDLQFLSVEKPKSYDKNAQSAQLANYSFGDNSEFSVNDAPNIIVVMCEAFADPKVLSPFDTNTDYMPFIHSLERQGSGAITGYMNCSIIAGNTPNSEFEFLTGNTLAFLPEGCIPYQQYIKEPIDAMPNYLKTLGYEVLAMHPYKSTGWNRNVVYPLLGFDRSLFVDYFEKRSPKYVRKYISDETLFEQIEYQYENKSDSPLFLFAVTMQNHSEYSGDLGGFVPDVKIDGIDYDALITRYLSLEKLTDSAFEKLCDYFKAVSDRTIIVFFGDHQSADYVVEPIWRLSGKSGSDLTFDEICDRYRVPFVIWANFDLDESHGVETSANYLGNLVLNAAGVPLTAYRSFIDEQMLTYPVLSAIRAVDASGAAFETSELSDELIDYRKMQYYELFDDDDEYP